MYFQKRDAFNHGLTDLDPNSGRVNQSTKSLLVSNKETTHSNKLL